jgi:hypothetical protein
MTGANSAVYKTNNQGASWARTVIDSSINYIIYSISVPSLSKLNFLPNGGTFHSSSDAGFTWNFISTVNISGFREIEFVNDSVGFISGFGMAKTIDGGATWNNQTFTPSSSIVFDALAGIFTISTTTLYSGGTAEFYRTYNSDDTILRTGISDVSQINSFKLYPNPIENTFYLKIEKEKNLHFQLYNRIGQHVEFSVQPNANRYVFAVRDPPRGLSFLNVVTNKSQTTMKLLKE